MNDLSGPIISAISRGYLTDNASIMPLRLCLGAHDTDNSEGSTDNM